ncbi:MAG: tetratricopeptide repeat protein [Spirochaetales bacterium]|nr:tetratricopeptide repeat protein [Spirochaetales bacterium]
MLLIINFSGFSESEYDLEKIELIEKSYKGSGPLWLLMERGKQAYELGEYGLSSRVFREVINRNAYYPDAHMWLGFIFEQEGEYLLAEKQYLKALEGRKQLYVIEDEFHILYKLADIYEKTDQYGKYEQILMSIIEKDDNYRDGFKLQYAMVDVLKMRGTDKLFELYRYDENKYNRARTELGIFYYKTGRYTEAENNLIFPVMSAATTGFDYIYEKTADYSFTSIISHVDSMNKLPVLREYLQKNDFYKSLYYLGASLYADGFGDTARELWSLVYNYDEADSNWRIRAGRQLQQPFIEPIITPRT